MATGIPRRCYYLPEGIIVRILSWLPVKSLLRFRCVCKRWVSLISNPQFIHIHLVNSHKNPSLLTLMSSFININTHSTTVSLTHLNSFQNSVDLRLPLPFTRMNFVTSSNGLLCLRNFLGNEIYIINPLTRQFKILPTPNIKPLMHPAVYLGFGFDSVSNDYKVLRILYQFTSFETMNAHVDVRVECYSTNTDSWKQIQVHNARDILLFYPHTPYLTSGPVVRGVLYLNGKDRLVSFDLHNEVLGAVSVPVLKPHETMSKAFVFNGALALVFNSPVTGKGPVRRVSIWTLDGLSWTPKFSLENYYTVDWEFMYLGDGHLVAFSDKNSSLVVYEYKKNNTKKYKVPSQSYVSGFLRYTESLVSIKGFIQFP